MKKKIKGLIFECLSCGNFFDKNMAYMCAIPHHKLKNQEVVACPQCRKGTMRVLLPK